MLTPSSSPSQSPASVWHIAMIAAGIAGLSALILLTHYQPPAASMFQQQTQATPGTSSPYLWLALRNGRPASAERAPRTRPRKAAQRVAT